MKFKRIEETYKIYAFVMSMAMMYPNPKTDKIRQLVIFFVFLLSLPLIIMIVHDITVRIEDHDMENLARQFIVGVAFIYSIVKIILTVIYKKELREIFDIISADYMGYNDLPEDYHETVLQTIRQSRLVEFVWTIILFSATTVFPFSAIALNIYSSFFADSPRRYMVLESHIWGISDEAMYSTPFYEIYFLYYLLVVVVIFISFTAFDGMFTICIFHLSLKIKILSNKLNHLLDDKSDLAKIKLNITEVVKWQYDIYNFTKKVVTCYKLWLVIIFIITVTQIGAALVPLTSSQQSSSATVVEELLFVATCVAHILMPCYLCSDATRLALQLGDVIYSIPWEDVPDTGFRRSICFMIARTQRPIEITVLELFTFNMEMFVSVLQAAYSMFTLLRK